MIESDFLESGTSFLVQSQSVVKQNQRNPRVVCTPISKISLSIQRAYSRSLFPLTPLQSAEINRTWQKKKPNTAWTLEGKARRWDFCHLFLLIRVADLRGKTECSFKKRIPLFSYSYPCAQLCQLKPFLNILYFQVLQEVFDGGNKENVEKELVTRDFLVLETSTQFFWCYDDTVHAK